MKRIHSILAWVAIAAISVAWTLLAGKDLNWDFINYHFYGPYSLLHHRLDVDYFAASFQGYLNPLGYLPLYGMIAADWKPVLIATILALVHSLNFVLLWIITDKILPETQSRRTLSCSLAVALAFLAPLQLATLGGTFFDPISSLVALFALLILTANASAVKLKHISLVGMVLGAAAGLKLTNLLLIPAAYFAIEVTRGVSLNGLLQRLATYSCFVAVGFFVTHGYWSYELWLGTGNPIFPVLNNIFGSSDFIQRQYQDRRYLGGGLTGLLLMPVEMLSHNSLVYSENVAADSRPLVFCGTVLLVGLHYATCRLKTSQASVQNSILQNSALKGLLAFALATYFLWAFTTRIGRYGYILWILIGPLTVALLSYLPWRRAMPVAVGVTICIQILFQYTNGNPRWSPSEYGETWLDVTVPDKLKAEPFAYLTITSLSYSAIVPYLHPESQVANIVGQYVQPVGQEMTQNLRHFLGANLNFKVLFSEKSHSDKGVAPKLLHDVDSILKPYGFKIEDNPCEYIEIKVPRINRGLNWWGKKAEAPVVTSLAVCDAVRISAKDMNDALQKLEEIDKVFNRVEKACQAILSPAGVQTLNGGMGWMRTYMNSNALLMTDGERVFISQFKALNDMDLGSLQQWRESEILPTCGKQVD